MKFIKIVLVTTALVLTTSANAALTNGYWDVTASGDGSTWNESVLIFTLQVPDGDNFILNGYFDWVGSGGSNSFGRENFTGTLFSDLSLQLTGFEIDPGQPWDGIGLGVYTAELTPDFTQIINGSWDVTSTLSAVQVVPLPAAVWLFGSGLIGLVSLARSKKA